MGEIGSGITSLEGSDLALFAHEEYEEDNFTLFGRSAHLNWSSSRRWQHGTYAKMMGDLGDNNPIELFLRTIGYFCARFEAAQTSGSFESHQLKCFQKFEDRIYGKIIRSYHVIGEYHVAGQHEDK